MKDIAKIRVGNDRHEKIELAMRGMWLAMSDMWLAMRDIAKIRVGNERHSQN